MSLFSNLIHWARLTAEKCLNNKFKPDFSDNFFISSLSDDKLILQNAKQEFTNNNIKNSQKLIVKYFRTRLTPDFFLTSNDVKRLVSNISDKHPAWRGATLRYVQRLVSEGMDVYNNKTKPLKDIGFWKTLEKGAGKDILYQVKPHRFGFAPQFILSIHYGGSTLTDFDYLISSWQEIAEKDCLAYLSDLTVISRIVSLSWAWFFLVALDDNEYPEKWSLEYKLLKIMHLDAVYLSKTENQSASNNHLMIYEFSKFYIGTLFPEFTDIKNWTNSQPDNWVAELKRQTYPDGGGFEPSLHYHQLFCETAIAYILLCKKNNISPEPWVDKQLELFLNFQISISGQSCNSLRIGDSSDHELFPLSWDGSEILPNLREIYRFLYQPNLAKISRFAENIEKAFWLLSGQIVSSPKPGIKKQENNFCCFNYSGFYIFNDENPNTRLIFRTGPKENCTVFAGHMHSDLLSVYMIVNGKPFIVNSGTYTYRSDQNDWPSEAPSWRKFFMGPESKNTIYIENEDPLGKINGDFRDSRSKARVRVTISHQLPRMNWIESEIIDANVYSNFRRGVIQLVNNYWIVYDVKASGGTVDSVSMGLQLAEKVKIEQDGNSINMRYGKEYLNLVWCSSLRLKEVLRGSVSPLGGWLSEKYGEIKAANYLKFEIAKESNLSVFALMACEDPNPDVSIHASQYATTELSLKTEKYTDYLVFRNDGRVGNVTSDKLTLNANAAMLVIRFDMNNRPISLKGLSVIEVDLFDIGLVIKCKELVAWLDLSLVDRSDSQSDGNIQISWVK